MYQAGLVAWGYSQVPGIKLVVNDITFLILLLVVIHFGYLAKIVDVETAFLYGNLEEEIYMECPQGMSNMGKDGCIILNKCIYGLVQAAQQYYKKAVKILKKLGLVRGNVDQWFSVKKSEMGIINVALYVDNNLMIGDIEAINNAIAAPKENGLN